MDHKELHKTEEQGGGQSTERPEVHSAERPEVRPAVRPEKRPAERPEAQSEKRLEMQSAKKPEMRPAGRLRLLSGAGVIAALILALDLLFLVMPKTDFSENENRYLRRMPELSLESLRSGKLTAGVNEWLCDHFPFRDGFMSLKTRLELAEGRSMINGVYIARDGYLIDPYPEPENMEKDIRIWREFAAALPADTGVRLMLVPSAVWTLREMLPPFAPWRDQQADAAYMYAQTGIAPADSFEALKAAGSGQLYYRTDHHWTTYGAYIGYTAYCRAAGLEPVPLTSWNAEPVTEDFKGTVYSRVNDYTVRGETIVSYSYPGDSLRVVYEDTQEESSSLYAPAWLEQKDKYSYFLDGLHSLITVTNDQAATDRCLAVVKDSYANCMIPFLAHHFRKIYIFDTRSYKAGPSAFIREHGDITDVLILYNLRTLDGDLGIGGIY